MYLQRIVRQVLLVLTFMLFLSTSHAAAVVANDSPVDVTVNCSNSTVEGSATQMVTPGVATRWVVSNITADAVCTASEDIVPDDYTQINADCIDVAVSGGETSVCTILNAGNEMSKDGFEDLTP